MSAAPRLLVPKLAPFYERLKPFTEPLVRLMAGGALGVHGYQILFGNIDGAARFFESAGFVPGLFWAYVVGLMELFCGLCLAAGFLTRLVAIPILIFLIVAIVTYHLPFGFNWESRGIEYPLFWALVVLHFLAHGGGPWSIDAKIGREI